MKLEFTSSKTPLSSNDLILSHLNADPLTLSLIKERCKTEAFLLNNSFLSDYLRTCVSFYFKSYYGILYCKSSELQHLIPTLGQVVKYRTLQKPLFWRVLCILRACTGILLRVRHDLGNGKLEIRKMAIIVYEVLGSGLTGGGGGGNQQTFGHLDNEEETPQNGPILEIGQKNGTPLWGKKPAFY